MRCLWSTLKANVYGNSTPLLLLVLLLKAYQTKNSRWTLYQFNSMEVGLGLHRHIQEIKKREKVELTDTGIQTKGTHIGRNNGTHKER